MSVVSFRKDSVFLSRTADQASRTHASDFGVTVCIRVNNWLKQRVLIYRSHIDWQLWFVKIFCRLTMKKLLIWKEKTNNRLEQTQLAPLKTTSLSANPTQANDVILICKCSSVIGMYLHLLVNKLFNFFRNSHLEMCFYFVVTAILLCHVFFLFTHFKLRPKWFHTLTVKEWCPNNHWTPKQPSYLDL